MVSRAPLPQLSAQSASPQAFREPESHPALRGLVEGSLRQRPQWGAPPISLLAMSLCGVAGLKPTLPVGDRENPVPSQAAICSGVGDGVSGQGWVRGNVVMKPPFPASLLRGGGGGQEPHAHHIQRLCRAPVSTAGLPRAHSRCDAVDTLPTRWPAGTAAGRGQVGPPRGLVTLL